MDARIQSGQLAVQALKDYKAAKAENNTVLMQESKEILQANMHNFGYGYLENKEQAVPPVALTFYSFHLMVALGSFFLFYLL